MASSYGLHIINRVHEPESHKILNALFDSLNTKNAFFIDVGANIGVFLLDIARRANVHVIGFEPYEACVAAIKKTMERNKKNNFSVFRNLVGDQEGLVPFTEDNNIVDSSIYTSKQSSPKIQQIKLDQVELLQIIEDSTPTVLMIDVEGYEPKVLRGGKGLITRLKPLIVFEYNFVSKRYFSINEIHGILGNSYQIYRLRKDAMLDKDVESAWNCVAIPRDTEFESVMKSRIYAGLRASRLG